MTETFVINQSMTQFKNMIKSQNLQHAQEKTIQQDPC